MADELKVASNEAPGPVQPQDRGGLAGVVDRLAWVIGAELSMGDVAQLRRLRPDDPSQPAFWKLCAGPLSGSFTSQARRAEEERGWAAIIEGMARTAKLGQRRSAGLHRRRASVGAALARCGYSELRFMRLLRAEGERLFDELRAAVRFLESRAEPFDWAELARLVLIDAPPDHEQTRRELARAYFRQTSTSKENS